MTISRRGFCAAGLGATIGSGLCLYCSQTARADYPTPNPFWDQHTIEAPQDINHEMFTAFLETYLASPKVGDIPRIYYRKAKEDGKGALLLSKYIQKMSEIRINLQTPNQQLAYWANLYNAVTILLIIDNYPINSIKDIGSIFRGPWSRKLVRVMKHDLSLDDIEHKIMRARWRDPLIHYIVNCASVGCPEIPPKTLTGATVRQEMQRLAKTYVNDSRGVSIGLNQHIVLSSIYHWYEDDFTQDGGVIAHLSKYATLGLKNTLEDAENSWSHAYDWSLNEAL